MKRLFWKKKQEPVPAEKMQKAAHTGRLQVEILGSGCAKCNALETAVQQALAELEWDAEVDHITDFVQIAAYGVMSTPALVVNGKLVCSGRVIRKEEVKKLLCEQGEQ